MHLLETKQLRKSYKGRVVVDSVSINVSRGEIVGLLVVDTQQIAIEFHGPLYISDHDRHVIEFLDLRGWWHGVGLLGD